MSSVDCSYWQVYTRAIAAWNSSFPGQSRTFLICLFRRCRLGEVSPAILSPTPNYNPLSLRASPDRDYVLPRSLDCQWVGRRSPSHLHPVAAYLTVLSHPRLHSPSFWLPLLRRLCLKSPRPLPHRVPSAPTCPLPVPSPVIHVQKISVQCRYLVELGSGEVHIRTHPGHIGLLVGEFHPPVSMYEPPLRECGNPL